MPDDTGSDSTNDHSLMPASVSAGGASASATCHEGMISIRDSKHSSSKLTISLVQQSPLLEGLQGTTSTPPAHDGGGSAPTGDLRPGDRKIRELEGKVGLAPLWRSAFPSGNLPTLNLQKLAETIDMAPMKPVLERVTVKDKKPNYMVLHPDAVFRWYASHGLATVLAQWWKEVKDNEQMDDDLPFALTSAGTTHTKEAEQLASCAMYLPEIEAKTVVFKHDQRDAMLACAGAVRSLEHCIESHILKFLDPRMFPNVIRYLFEVCARTLITAYCDLMESKKGFFGVLLSSVFAQPMTPEAHDAWEDHLGLSHRILSEDLERLTPSIRWQRAALAFGHAMQLERLRNPHFDDRSLVYKEKAMDMNKRLTSLHRALNDEANSFPELLTAFDVAALPPPPRALPRRIEDDNMVHQPVQQYTPVTALQTKRKRVPGSKGANLNQNTRPASTKKTAGGPKHANTQTPRISGALKPVARAKHNRQENSAALDSVQTGSIGGKKRKAAATTGSPPPDRPAIKKKRKGATTLKIKDDNPSSQDAAAATTATQPESTSEENRKTIASNASLLASMFAAQTNTASSSAPQAIANPQATLDSIRGSEAEIGPLHKSNEDPRPVDDDRFATVNGRIFPSGKSADMSSKTDRFTEKEQLALLRRYKEVSAAVRNVGGDKTEAEKWWDMWKLIAYVLPGRSDVECIRFYVENKQHFQL